MDPSKLTLGVTLPLASGFDNVIVTFFPSPEHELAATKLTEGSKCCFGVPV